MSEAAKLERYPSGSRGLIANELVGEYPSGGSNPPLSVLIKGLVFTMPHSQDKIVTSLVFPSQILPTVKAVLGDVRLFARLNPLVKEVEVDEDGSANITDVLYGFIPIEYKATSKVLDTEGLEYINTAASPFPFSSQQLQLSNKITLSPVEGTNNYQLTELAQVTYPPKPTYLPRFIYDYLKIVVRKNIEKSHREMFEKCFS